MEIYQNNFCFEQTYSLRTVIYYGKTMVLWKQLWYYGKKYGPMKKTMILYRKLWNFYLLWKSLWYYGNNYGTIVNYSLP